MVRSRLAPFPREQGTKLAPGAFERRRVREGRAGGDQQIDGEIDIAGIIGVIAEDRGTGPRGHRAPSGSMSRNTRLSSHLRGRTGSVCGPEWACVRTDGEHGRGQGMSVRGIETGGEKKRPPGQVYQTDVGSCERMGTRTAERMCG